MHVTRALMKRTEQKRKESHGHKDGKETNTPTSNLSLTQIAPNSNGKMIRNKIGWQKRRQNEWWTHEEMQSNTHTHTNTTGILIYGARYFHGIYLRVCRLSANLMKMWYKHNALFICNSNSTREMNKNRKRGGGGGGRENQEKVGDFCCPLADFISSFSFVRCWPYDSRDDMWHK